MGKRDFLRFEFRTDILYCNSPQYWPFIYHDGKTVLSSNYDMHYYHIYHPLSYVMSRLLFCIYSTRKELSVVGLSSRILDWTIALNSFIFISKLSPNKEQLQGCFRLCDWVSLQCLVPLILLIPAYELFGWFFLACIISNSSIYQRWSGSLTHMGH